VSEGAILTELGAVRRGGDLIWDSDGVDWKLIVRCGCGGLSAVPCGADRL
jgi:hypothetical protein